MSIDPKPQSGGSFIMEARYHPGLINALNLIRSDAGGMHWPPQDVTTIPERWKMYLDRMEEAINNIDDAGGIDSDLQTFLNGEHYEMMEIAQRSPDTLMTHEFVMDFFDGWASTAPKGQTEEVA